MQSGWEIMQGIVDEFVEEKMKELADFRNMMTGKIEAAERNEVMKAIQTLATRFDRIEEKLTPPDEPDPAE